MPYLGIMYISYWIQMIDDVQPNQCLQSSASPLEKIISSSLDPCDLTTSDKCVTYFNGAYLHSQGLCPFGLSAHHCPTGPHGAPPSPGRLLLLLLLLLSSHRRNFKASTSLFATVGFLFSPRVMLWRNSSLSRHVKLSAGETWDVCGRMSSSS